MKVIKKILGFKVKNKSILKKSDVQVDVGRLLRQENAPYKSIFFNEEFGYNT